MKTRTMRVSTLLDLTAAAFPAGAAVLAMALATAAPVALAAEAKAMSDDHAGHIGMTAAEQKDTLGPPKGSPAFPEGQKGMAPPMDPGSMKMQGGSAPPDARDPNAYSNGYTRSSGPYALGYGLKLADQKAFAGLLVDRLEWSRSDGSSAGDYDGMAWYGTSYNRAILKGEGEIAGGKLRDARTELLWGHAVSAYWDTQVGLRVDSASEGPNRNWLAFGVQGLAPYWFELEATAYVGDQGRTALRLSGEYELLLTQKLILQPRIETNLYGKTDVANGIGSGLSDIEAGLRLRYEFSRQFAPYVGVSWSGKFGRTADFAAAAGQDRRDTRFVAGVRFWF
ncbi:MAG: copper resistance protein B [Rubrivivax sp.]